MVTHRCTRCLKRVHLNLATRICAFLLLFPGYISFSQSSTFTPEQISQSIDAFKEDPRGPFQGIRWFCTDGTTRSPQERCDEPGGIQHALVKDIVVQLASRNGIHIGQILAGTDFNEFLDRKNRHARLKHYQLERFLSAADNGWIYRKAQFYRGAFQAEDEEKWGLDFLSWLVSQNDLVTSQYFLLREAARDIPHSTATNALQQIRAQSKELSDGYAPFMEMRIKIHGQPEASDTLQVNQFRQTHANRLSKAQRQKMDELLNMMTAYYRVDPMTQIRNLSARLPVGSPITAAVATIDRSPTNLSERMHILAQVLYDIRTNLPAVTRPADRLRMVDLSLQVESYLFRLSARWKPATYRELVQKGYYLTQAAVGAGLIEFWEWDALQPQLDLTGQDRIASVGSFTIKADAIKRGIEWSIGTVMAAYEDEVSRFTAFEPIAAGFIDDRMRSTLLLPLGEVSGEMGGYLAEVSGQINDIMGLRQSSAMRGLNPGVAVGRLVVLTGQTESLDFRTDEIYVMSRAPAELKPVGGIATVSEGNMVSHVQLLARNLAIPNAVLSPELVRNLEAFSGQRVFYAVSPKGAVRLKLASDMSSEERALIEERRRSESRIQVPIERLELSNTSLTSLHDLRANDSGRLCGPKAANLGQLSSLFPGYVAPGFIIPFGVFRNHMDQKMPSSQISYWDFLRTTFTEAETMRKSGTAEDVVEKYVLGRLEALRNAIEKMPLQPAFLASLKIRFSEIFGDRLGAVPVFVRSDTNMEDLKDFTGAGLNLTVPNVVTEEAFLQAIRRVWASPYRERGYGWRQKYLLNPEDVYPSLLVLRSVNVEKSGVLITTGVSSGNTEDVTVAFNRGVGGAVDGQAAESYTISPNQTMLLAPAREPVYTNLPQKGGVERISTTFEKRILTEANLETLRTVAEQIKRLLPGAPGIETQGPFDVELGLLDGTINLFQARPFVQNRSAGSIQYLTEMDRRPAKQATIDLDAKLPTR